MTDVRLFCTPDGGEIEFVAGQATMADGLESAAYLSLFGGNDEDAGADATRAKQWWGNLSEADPAKRYRSETQSLLESVPAIPFNLRRVEDAVLRDLDWFVTTGVASALTCAASLPAIDHVHLDIEFTINGEVFPVSFSHPWHA